MSRFVPTGHRVVAVDRNPASCKRAGAMNPALRAACAILAVALPSCNSTPDDLREWRPSDHQHTTEPSNANDPRAAQVSGSAQPLLPGLEDVTVVTWQRTCANCHGPLGHGDGPQGAMVKARDLSDPAWQASVTDEQIATSIAKGRGLMPPSSLPGTTIEGLVRLVRLLDRNRMAEMEKGARAAQSAAPPNPSSAP